MTVANPSLGEVFQVRIYKSHVSNPTREWSNTYKVRAESGGEGFVMLRGVAEALVSGERALHFDVVQYRRAIISTAVPDGEPYNPLTFVTMPLSGVGGRGTLGQELVALHLCLRAQFSVSTGRQGYRLYRGCLSENEVSAPAGEPILQGTAITSAFGQARTNGFSELFNGELGYSVVLSEGAHTRVITDLVPAGVSVKKLNNRYFDHNT